VARRARPSGGVGARRRRHLPRADQAVTKDGPARLSRTLARHYALARRRAASSSSLSTPPEEAAGPRRKIPLICFFTRPLARPHSQVCVRRGSRRRPARRARRLSVASLALSRERGTDYLRSRRLHAESHGRPRFRPDFRRNPSSPPICVAHGYASWLAGSRARRRVDIRSRCGSELLSSRSRPPPLDGRARRSARQRRRIWAAPSPGSPRLQTTRPCESASYVGCGRNGRRTPCGRLSSLDVGAFFPRSAAGSAGNCDQILSWRLDPFGSPPLQAACVGRPSLVRVGAQIPRRNRVPALARMNRTRWSGCPRPSATAPRRFTCFSLSRRLTEAMLLAIDSLNRAASGRFPRFPWWPRLPSTAPRSRRSPR